MHALSCIILFLLCFCCYNKLTPQCFEGVWLAKQLRGEIRAENQVIPFSCEDESIEVTVQFGSVNTVKSRWVKPCKAMGSKEGDTMTATDVQLQDDGTLLSVTEENQFTCDLLRIKDGNIQILSNLDNPVTCFSSWDYQNSKDSYAFFELSAIKTRRQLCGDRCCSKKKSCWEGECHSPSALTTFPPHCLEGEWHTNIYGTLLFTDGTREDIDCQSITTTITYHPTPPDGQMETSLQLKFDQPCTPFEITEGYVHLGSNLTFQGNGHTNFLYSNTQGKRVCDNVKLMNERIVFLSNMSNPYQCFDTFSVPMYNYVVYDLRPKYGNQLLCGGNCCDPMMGCIDGQCVQPMEKPVIGLDILEGTYLLTVQGSFVNTNGSHTKFECKEAAYVGIDAAKATFAVMWAEDCDQMESTPGGGYTVRDVYLQSYEIPSYGWDADRNNQQETTEEDAPTEPQDADNNNAEPSSDQNEQQTKKDANVRPEHTDRNQRTINPEGILTQLRSTALKTVAMCDLIRITRFGVELLSNLNTPATCFPSWDSANEDTNHVMLYLQKLSPLADIEDYVRSEAVFEFHDDGSITVRRRTPDNPYNPDEEKQGWYDELE
eukprot:TRINITY_DN67741_c8_g2_i1.p1 TRINITY_DN67741_c8_g2~~TRINITY_DN67741_c8_g2_i1.p1  ORF type:complete len:602 (+),score=23.59 TRINITY_DN67741_c8_g2_i1:39-1844(+)